MRTLTIRELPLDERPRERLASHGAQTLSNAELLAILIGSGTPGRSALDLARELLGDGLPALSRREWCQGKRSHGLGLAKSARIAAALELGRRISAHTNEVREPIRKADDIAQQLIARYSHYSQERLGAVFLDAKNRPIREREIYVGTVNAAMVSTRDVIRYALDDGAAGIILFHNHPSGDPSPSAEDLFFTRKMNEASKLLGIDFQDHLIIGSNCFVSLREKGAMK